MQLGAAIQSVALAAVSMPRPLPPDIRSNAKSPGDGSPGAIAVQPTERERIYLNCRVCLCDIHEHNNPNVNIFCKDFLDEKIRRYLYVNIDFSDKFPKRICQICLIKLDDIHGFACYAQKNQQILARFRENQRVAEAEAASIAAQASAAASPTQPTRSTTAGAKSQQPRKLSSHKKTILANNDITIFAYDDLKLGQFIKDHDLLTLILKALKWGDLNDDKEAQLERLRQSNFQDVLCNPDLLQDEDLMQLLGPYMNREPSLSITRHSPVSNGSVGVMDGLRELNENKNITEMEVGVDPELFFPDDDDETRSAEEAAVMPFKEDVKPIFCTECSQIFTSQTDLLEHNRLQHDTSIRLVAKRRRVVNNPPAIVSPKGTAPPLNLTIAKVDRINNKLRAVATKTVYNEAILVSDAEVDEPKPKAKRRKTAERTTRRPRKNAKVQTAYEESDSDVVLVTPSDPPTTADDDQQSIVSLPVELPKTRRRLSSRRPAVGEPPIVRSRKKRTRTTSPRFTCHHCGQKLSTKGNLKVHIETHKPKGKFNCDKCGRVFKTALNLGRHKKYHSGEKFTCPQCARVYPTNSTLRAHIITHSNIRPHECPICMKTFKRNQDLKFHINQHTGDKPYKCSFCPKAFASSGNCFSHRKRMHSDMIENIA